MATDYSMFSPVDFDTNPFFTGEIGSGIPGLDFMTWGGGLSGLDSSEFMTNPQFERGSGSIQAYQRSSGEEGTGFNLNKLFDVLEKNNYSLREYSPIDSNTRWSAVFDNNTNMPLAAPQRNTLTSAGDRLFAGAAMSVLNPFGGPLVGGIGGGLGGTLASGNTAVGINGAVSGGFNALRQGGNLKDIFKGSLAGGLSGGMPNVGDMLGIDSGLGDVLNSAIRGGTRAALGGDDITQNALMSALPAAGSYLSDMFSPIPDVGTIGGTMQDDFGESSVTMNSPTDMQFMANSQAMSADPSMSLPTTASDVPQSNNLLDQVSSIIGNISPQQFGNIAQGLAGMYLGYRQRRNARDLRRQLTSNRGAYETQLRQNLERRDAASGRRSNYAGRETQLQAALAELDSRNAPVLSQINNLEMQGLGGMFNSGLVTGNRLGWWGQPSVMPTMSSSMPSLSSLGSTGPTASYSLMDNQNRNRYRLGGN